MSFETIDDTIKNMQIGRSELPFRDFNSMESQWRRPRVTRHANGLYHQILTPVQIPADYPSFFLALMGSQVVTQLNVKTIGKEWERCPTLRLSEAMITRYLSKRAQANETSANFLSVHFQNDGYEAALDFAKRGDSLVGFCLYPAKQDAPIKLNAILPGY